MPAPVTWSFTTEPPATTASAVFIKQDTTTEGNWIGTYGTRSQFEIEAIAQDRIRPKQKPR
jgi:hypothetical protein